jgi:hypothetical protein
MAHVKEVRDMARPKSPAKSIHTTIRLPEDLHQRLTLGAKRLPTLTGHVSLADEIKQRLEWSFEWEDKDPPTLDLVRATMQMGGLIYGDTGAPWHANAYLRTALAEAVAAWLAERVPGDANVPSVNADASIAASATWLRKGDTAKTAGEKLLGLYKVFRAPEEAMARYQEKLRTNPLMRQAHEQWEQERAAGKAGLGKGWKKS